jgi:hypothetical protein
MKNPLSILSAIVLLFAFSCGGGSSSSEEKSGIYEPETQKQFVQILDEMGIKPYPGAEITRFTHLTDATLAYKVSSGGNTNKDILDYYKLALENAFKDKSGWEKYMETSGSIMYMKGFDLTFSFAITSKNMTNEAAGDMGNVPKYLKYKITLGDGADSY